MAQKFKPGGTKSASGRPNYARGVTGGAASKMVSPPIKAGSPNTRKATPDGAASVGRIVGNHVSDAAGSRTTQRPNAPLYTEAKDFVRMGNDVATNVGRGGPGAGRKIHRSGSQGQW
jgi:hypothetical protein